jgi:SAM-dependent methyltransferase
MDPSSLDPVQAQYERWVYPPRVYDLAELPLATQGRTQDMHGLSRLFWPQAPYRDDLDILVAGCGSLAAAAQAYVYPRARVVGIDVSRASLEHEDLLKRKHNLSNLTLHHMRVEDVAALAADFNFIICHGVLHHLEDAAAGLHALGQVLRTDGVIDVMVYGKYGRLGVTVLQDLFRVMGLEQDAAGVQVVKDTLAALAPTHPVQTHRRMAAQDMASDEGLVDTFLHRRERTYSCGDCLDLVQGAGLVFQGWKENGLYHPDTRIPANHPLWPHLRKLNQRALWQTVEMLDASISAHWFHACRPDRNPASYVIQFEDDAFLDYAPIARISKMAPPDRPGAAVLVTRPPLPPMALDERQAQIFRHTNGSRSVRECLALAGLAEGPATIALARSLFRALWHVGYVLFHLT